MEPLKDQPMRSAYTEPLTNKECGPAPLLGGIAGFEEIQNPALGSSFVRRMGVVAIAAFISSLVACTGRPTQDTPNSGESLRNNLMVASAALAAGQPAVARRLYLSLAEQFDNPPEPILGLGYIAFRSNDFTAAKRYFLQAAERATDKSALKAEALLGAGRTALAQGDPHAARQHFQSMHEPGKDTPSAAWLSNGLAVTATLDGDYEIAEALYVDAFRHSSGDPRIAANLVRMLIAAGRIDDAVRMYAEHDSSYWVDDDGRKLLRLIGESRQNHRGRDRQIPQSTKWGTVPSESGGQGTVASKRLGLDTLRSRVTTEPSRPVSERSGQASLPYRLHSPRLTLRLSEFGLSVSRSSKGTKPIERIELQDSSTLAFRLSDELGLLMSPTVGNTLAKPSSSATPAILLTQSSGTPPPALLPSGPSELTPEVKLDLNTTQTQSLTPESPTAQLSPTTLILTLGQSQRLNLTGDAASVLVASPEIADVQLLLPDMLYVIAKSVGRTSIVVIGDDGVQEQVVSVVLDLEPLRAILAEEPDLRGVRVRHISHGIALTGEVGSAASADHALRLASAALPEDVPVNNELWTASSQQVNLEVQIAEVQRSIAEDLGINWEAFRISGGGGLGIRIGRIVAGAFTGSVVDGDLPSGLGGLLPITSIDGQPASSLFFARRTGNSMITGMIDALANAGMANVLARPNLTAVSGEAASFFSGGEFPLPTGFEDGTIVFEYKKFGVLLDFVPTVIDTGRIVLAVRPEVSEPSQSQSVQVATGINVPVINVRRAETTVEVGNGESIVIAGLFRNASSTRESGIPGLKDLPVFGALFRQTSTRSDELELIVIVTARLVHATAAPENVDVGLSAYRANGYHY